MKVIPLAVQKTRTKWQPIFKRGEGPTCYSANALSTTITVRDHIEKGCVSCAKRYDGATDDILDTLKRCDRTCPHFTASPWDDKRADDYCSPGYASLLYDVTETDGEVLVEGEDGNEYGGEVVMLRTSGVNSKHTPDFVGLTNRIGRGGKMVARPKNLRQRVFNMSAEEKPTDSGTAAELILIPGAQTDLEFVKALWAEGKERYNLALRQEPEIEGQNALGAGGFVGSLPRDPELRYTPYGKAVCEFALSTEGGTYYFVRVWEEAAEWCNEDLSKGMQVRIEGSVKVEEFDTKDGPQSRPVLTATSVEVLE